MNEVPFLIQLCWQIPKCLRVKKVQKRLSVSSGSGIFNYSFATSTSFGFQTLLLIVQCGLKTF